MPKAWDFFFTGLSKKGEAVAIVLTLTDGRRIGGIWAETPFASSYPADEDLLITVPCVIDQESGHMLERIEGAKGLLVKRADIVTIEAYNAASIMQRSNVTAQPPPNASVSTEDPKSDG